MTNQPIYEIKSMYAAKVKKRKFSENAFITETAVEIHNGKLIAWYYDRISVAEITDGKILRVDPQLPLNTEYLLRLRVFNQTKEWHVWKQSDGIYGRLRDDNVQEESVEFVDATMRVKEVIAKQVNTSNNIQLTTRNYIGYLNGQAGYEDCRFLSLK